MKYRLILLLVALFIHSISIKAKNYYVATSGSDSNSGLNSNAPFATIQQAVNMANSGRDSIFLQEGTYNQTTTISSKNGITITNYVGAPVILDGTGSLYTQFFMIEKSPNISITGLIFQNLGINYARAIYVFESTAPASSNLTISNNSFTEINSSSKPYTSGYTNSSSGANVILVAGGIDNPSSPIMNVNIIGNSIKTCELGFSEAISVKGNVNGFIIANNTVQDVSNIGIDAAGLESWPALTNQSEVAQNGTIRNNTLINCIDHRTSSDNGALYVDGGSNINILYNTLTRNKFGISVGCENQIGYSGAIANNIQVRDNYMYYNTLSALLIGTNGSGTVGGLVTNSVIEGNTCFMDADSTGMGWDGELYLQNINNLLIRNNIFYLSFLRTDINDYQLGNYGNGILNLTLGYNNFYPGGNNSGVSMSDANRNWGGYTIENMESIYSISDPGSIFSNPSLNGYIIQTGSVDINAGDPNYVPLPGETDLVGNIRLQGGRVDIGCFETNGTVISPTGLSISPANASIIVYGTQQLTDTVMPEGAAQGVTWTSSNTNVATVSPAGLVTGSGPGIATITATTPNGLNATCQINVSSTLPTQWRTTDIGIVSPTGSATYTNGVFTINGSGWDIYESTDAFRFVYQPLTCNGQIVANVNSMTNTNGWAKAGVIIKGDLNAASSYVLCAITPSNGVIMEYYDSTTNITNQYQITGSETPKWLKLVRSGNIFTAYYSTNGNSWNLIGSSTVSIDANAFIGLAITSHANGTLCTATIDNVAVTTQCEVLPTSLSVNPNNANILTADTIQLSVIMTPSTSTQEVTWISNNVSVAKVSNTGLVTGVLTGNAIISAFTANDLKASCTITVNAGTSIISVSTSSIEITSSRNNIATFTITSNLDWTIYSTESWLTPYPVSGSDNETITLTALVNNNSNPRSDTIIVTGNGSINDTVFVSQEAEKTDGLIEIMNSGINLYPSPVEKNLTISLPKQFCQSKISIYTLAGTEEYNAILAGEVNEIYMGEYIAGVYIVKIVTQSGDVITRKIIKQ